MPLESRRTPQVRGLGLAKDEAAIERGEEWGRQSPGHRCRGPGRLTSHCRGPFKKQKAHSQVLRKQTRVGPSESLLFK